MRLDSLPGEFVQERRLAAARLAHDQGHPTPTGQGQIQQPAQPGQLLPARHETRRGDGGRGRHGDGQSRRGGDAETAFGR
jgi:hypothetical protein